MAFILKRGSRHETARLPTTTYTRTQDNRPLDTAKNTAFEEETDTNDGETKDLTNKVGDQDAGPRKKQKEERSLKERGAGGRGGKIQRNAKPEKAQIQNHAPEEENANKGKWVGKDREIRKLMDEVRELKNILKEKDRKIDELKKRMQSEAAKQEDIEYEFPGTIEDQKRLLEEQRAEIEEKKIEIVKIKDEKINLTGKLKDLAARLSSMQQEKQELKQKLDQPAFNHDGLNTEVQRLREQSRIDGEKGRQELGELMQELQQKNDKVLELIEQADGLKSKLNELELYRERTAELEVGFKKATKRISQYAEEVTKLKFQNTKLDDKYRAQVDKLNEEMGRYQKLEDQSAKEIARLHSEAAQNLEEASDLNTRVHKLMAQEKSFRSDFEVEKNANQQLQTRVDGLKGEVEQHRLAAKGFQDQAEKLRNHAKRLEETQTKRQGELISHQESLGLEAKRRDVEITNLKNDIESLNTQIQQLASGKESLQSELTVEKHTTQQLQIKVDRLTQEVDQNRRLAKDFRDQAEKLRSDAKRLEEMRTKRQGELISHQESLELGVKRRDAEIVNFKNDIESLNTQIQQLISGKENLQSELTGEKHTTQQLKVKVDGLMQEVDQNRRLAKGFQDQAEKLRSDAKRLEEMQTKRQGELISHQESLGAEAKRRDVEITNLKNDIESLNTQIQQLASGKESLQSELTGEKHKAQQLQIKADGLMNEVDRGHQYAKGFQDQAKMLGDKVKVLQETETKQQRQLESLMELLDKTKLQVRQKDAKIIDLKNDIVGLETERDSVQKQYKLLEKSKEDGGKELHAQLKLELEQSRQEMVELKKEIQKQEDIVIKAQETAGDILEMKVGDEIQTVEDEELEGTFQVDIEARAKKWADQNAIRVVEDEIALGSTFQQEITKLAGEEKEARAMCRKYDPDIIVNALLVQYITDNVLKKPFLLFEQVKGIDIAAKMAKWYETKVVEDKKAANKWRQLEIRWLETTMPRDFDSDDTPIKVDDAKCDELARLFLNGPAKSLLKINATNDGLKGLTTIVKQAIRLGLVMWKQSVDIEIRGYQDLKGRRFAVDDKEIKTHPSQLNPVNPKGLPSENAVMDMVIQPSFVVRQSENAEKVWGQAVVLWH